MDNENGERDLISFDDIDDGVIENLTPLQMKAANVIVLSPHLTSKKISEMLGISTSTLSSWKKDPNFQNYLTHFKKKYNERDINLNARRNAFIADATFDEIFTRMNTKPDPEKDLPEDYTFSQLEKYYDRFLDAVSFKDLMRVWEQVDKRTRLDQGDATSITETKQVAEQIRTKYEALMIRRNKFDNFIQSEGINLFENIFEKQPKKIESNVIDVENESAEDKDIVLARYEMEMSGGRGKGNE